MGTNQAPPRYVCLNPRCPNYSGVGVVLQASDVHPGADNLLHCNACSSLVSYAPPNTSQNPAIAGMAVGAALGAAVGGAPGALVGGLVGLVLATSGSNPSR